MYEGYLLEYDGLKLPFVNVNGRELNVIVPGTYTSDPNALQEVGSWKDANGDTVKAYFPHRKTAISFDICGGMADQFAALSTIWTHDNPKVKYWDDSTQTYKEGIFRRGRVSFKHHYDTQNHLFYDRTTVTLEEV